MLIHKDALVVTEATSAEDTRYFLNGAFFDKQGRAVATDGHTLARFTSKPMNAADFPKIDGIEDVTVAEDTIVSRDDLVAAMRTIGKRDGKRDSPFDPQYLALVPNGKTVTIATAKSDRSVQITARKIEATFPAYERVLTVKSPVRATVVLNPHLLETLARMVRQVGARHIELTLHSDTTVIHDQILFKAEGEHGILDGAIMPMRS